MEQYRATVRTLAARAALLIISNRDHAEIVDRVLDFMEDRGAIGMLLSEYESGESIERVALRYWDSRIERTGSRLEDLVVTTILAVLSSVVAGIIVEMWKGEWGPLKHFFRPEDKDPLSKLSRDLARTMKDMQQLSSLYEAKTRGAGVADEAIARELYDMMAAGETFNNFVGRHEHAADASAELVPLSYARDASRGVIVTELERAGGLPMPKFFERRIGLQLSPFFAFGETIALSDSPDLGLGPEWDNSLTKKLTANRLYADYWPQGVVSYGPSPKILILDDRVFDRLRRSGHNEPLLQTSGFISLNSGPVSHLAVLSRRLGIGAVRCTFSEEERARAKFALLREGIVDLYFDRPGATADDMQLLVSAMRARFNSGN